MLEEEMFLEMPMTIPLPASQASSDQSHLVELIDKLGQCHSLYIN